MQGNKDAQSFWGGLMPDALAQYHEEVSMHIRVNRLPKVCLQEHS